MIYTAHSPLKPNAGTPPYATRSVDSGVVRADLARGSERFIFFLTRQHCALDTEGDDREEERRHTDEDTQLDPGGNVDLVWSELLARATTRHTGRQPEEWLELGGEQDVDPLRQHADDE